MRKISTLRKIDVKNSDIVSLFLEKYFYPIYTTDYKKYNDVDNQFKGIDCSFTFNNKKFICDEKASVQYINKPLFTFAFELSFIDISNNIHDGWLIDGTKTNNSYLLCWIDKAKSNNLSDMADIQSMEIALLDRMKIIKYLNNLGWNDKSLKIKMNRLRINENENLGNLKDNGLKFSKSFHLVEKPINVLISREKLKELSEFTSVLNTT